MSCAIKTAALLIINAIILIESHKRDLRFVSVVFRHGDSAPVGDGKEAYSTDPYLNSDFLPMSQGGLTNVGKRREYALGQLLKERYDEFLGKIYFPKDVEGRSTDDVRTKMSLLVVLDGLYPPAPEQILNDAVHWQPIPISNVSKHQDTLLTSYKCPRYLEEVFRVRSLPEVISLVDEFRPLMNYLTNSTGKPIVNTTDMLYLFHGLMAEKSVGLALPEWTKNIFPDGDLRRAASLEYDILSYNDLLKKLNGGSLLKRMTEDMVAIVDGTPVEARKINLFGGHDTNVAALLHTLGVSKPHVPEYSSAVILELFKGGDQHYVRVVHYLGIPPTFEELTIPGCDVFCPLPDFLGLLKNVMPTDKDLDCQPNVAAAAG